MTRKEHIEKFNHNRYFNKIADNYPSNTYIISGIRQWDLLSKYNEENIRELENLNMIKQSGIKPCPLCGGEAKNYIVSYALRATGCLSCNVRVTDSYDDMDVGDATEKWNTRV